MVFDNSGRTSQLRAAKRAGARLVFSSRAPKLRWKAFRFKWMRLLDEHWIVFPTFVTGGLTWLERQKMRLFPGYTVRRLDTLFPPADPEARRDWLARHGLEPRRLRGVRARRPQRGPAHRGARRAFHRGGPQLLRDHRLSVRWS